MTDQLINSDCLEGMRAIPSESIDLVITDCPYHIKHRGTATLGGIFSSEYALTGKLFKYNDIKFSEWLPEVYRVLKKGTHCYIMINALNLSNLQTEAEKVGFVFQNLLVWDKGTATPSHYYMQCLEFILLLSKRPARNINDMGAKNLLSVPNIIGTKKHPTAKPVALMERMIQQSSNEGDIVLDPFVGSGSTLIAARNLNRHYIGYEIDEQYYKVAKQQLSLPKTQLLF